MSFSNLVAALDASVLSTFAPDIAPTVTIHPKDGSQDLILSVTVKNPALEEDYLPGSQPNVSVLLLFVHPDPAGYIPSHGDTATYGVGAGADYDIFESPTDREGGMTLKLRRRGQRYDR